MSSVLVDMITATLIFGILALSAARVQANINVTMYENQFNVVTQTNAVELARQIEWDFTKIGYHITGQKIFVADSTKLQFTADLCNTKSTNTVIYSIGDPSQCAMTKNKNDFPLFRSQDSKSVTQNWGLTYFRLTYYDSTNKKISTPITGSTNLARIHAITASFRLEGPEPVVDGRDSVWSAVTWKKTITPRNLGDLSY
jgi:hypothetical protein